MTTMTIIIWLLTGVLCSYFAIKRGRDPWGWFVLGLLFGLFAFIALFVLSPKDIGSLEKPDEPTTTITITPEVIEPVNNYLTHEWFYLDKQGKQFGPIPFENLKTLWKEQRVTKTSFVWSQGMNEWKKIENIQDLLNILS